MKAVRKHVTESWISRYVERWLKAPMQQNDGSKTERTRGTPQGGVISPVLSNLFLHYVFDVWMTRQHPDLPWCRYADDGLVHCKTQQQTEALLLGLKERFTACELELHPDKTQIVYCKDGSRKKEYLNKSFTFLGYTFRARQCKNTKQNKLFSNFTPAVSKESAKSMRERIRKSNLRNQTELSLKDIAQVFNPILQGWLNYYGRYTRSALHCVWRHFNQALLSWAMKKYKSLKKCKTRALSFLEGIAKKKPDLFVHWRAGMLGAFT